MAKQDGSWPSFRALLLIVFSGMLLAQPVVRRRQRKDNARAADIGETVATYMLGRDRKSDRQAKIMMAMTGVSCLAAIAAVVAAFLA